MSALQKLRAIHLYRHSLKNMLSWAIRREVFYEEVRRAAAAAAAGVSPVLPAAAVRWVVLQPTTWLRLSAHRRPSCARSLSR